MNIKRIVGALFIITLAGLLVSEMYAEMLLLVFSMSLIIKIVTYFKNDIEKIFSK